ncbi:hypothetical protein AAY473_040121 [Plecturocebus cupreus]
MEQVCSPSYFRKPREEECLRVALQLPRLECSGAFTSHCSLDFLGSKTRSHHVAQAGLKPLGSGNPALATQDSGITGRATAHGGLYSSKVEGGEVLLL